jgi:putative transposase
MQYKTDKGCHSVYAIQCHMVMCVKYRKKILTGDLDERRKKEFPLIMKKHLWGGVFWSPSYFLASTGQVTLEVIRRYVETQEEA